jgi:hypothetical protein
MGVAPKTLPGHTIRQRMVDRALLSDGETVCLACKAAEVQRRVDAGELQIRSGIDLPSRTGDPVRDFWAIHEALNLQNEAMYRAKLDGSDFNKMKREIWLLAEANLGPFASTFIDMGPQEYGRRFVQWRQGNGIGPSSIKVGFAISKTIEAWLFPMQGHTTFVTAAGDYLWPAAWKGGYSDSRMPDGGEPGTAVRWKTRKWDACRWSSYWKTITSADGWGTVRA